MHDRPVGLAIDQRGAPPRLALVLGGELDIASSPRLQELVTRLCADGARALTIDLGGLAFIDSSGLAAIVYASRLCERRGCELTLVPGVANVQRVFDISGLADLLPFRAAPEARVAREARETREDA